MVARFSNTPCGFSVATNSIPTEFTQQLYQLPQISCEFCGIPAISVPISSLDHFTIPTSCICTRAFGENNLDGFLKEMKDMFGVVGRFLSIESDVIMPTQVHSRFVKLFTNVIQILHFTAL